MALIVEFTVPAAKFARFDTLTVRSKRWGTVLRRDLAAAGYTVGVAPFMILLSYILRIGTITQRTLSMGPFILRESRREDDIDWSS